MVRCKRILFKIIVANSSRMSYNIFVVTDTQFKLKGEQMNAYEIHNAILTSELTATDLCTLNDAIETVRDRFVQDVVVNQRVKWTFCKSTNFGTVQSVTSEAVQVLVDSGSQLWWVPTDILQAA